MHIEKGAVAGESSDINYNTVGPHVTRKRSYPISRFTYIEQPRKWPILGIETARCFHLVRSRTGGFFGQNRYCDTLVVRGPT